MVGPELMHMLNETRSIDGPTVWNSSECSRLWLYNLHYFDDLVAADAPKRLAWHQALMSRWISENPPGVGVGWEPYPVSLRIVNWIKWALQGTPIPEECIQSLAVQARWLRGHVEWHLLGNHLVANAKALIFAGAFFRGTEAEGWLRDGIEILRTELDEQILSDGGHFERSPMYHGIILEDLLDLLNLRCAFGHRLGVHYSLFSSKVSIQVPRMVSWLVAMCHPDGEISLFNDAAMGIAASPSELVRYASRLGFAQPRSCGDGLIHLAASGYVRMQQGPVMAILDVGEVGPRYLPGHAHADTLSYELSLFGHRVAANSGTSTYALGPQRQYQRSTAAHNAVEVDGEDSSEVWGGFRVARRALPVGLELREDDAGMDVSCGHDGYRRLRGRVLHRRTWRLADSRMTVTDRLTGRCRWAVSRIHLHPDVEASMLTGDSPAIIDLCVDGRNPGLVITCPTTLLGTEYHPEFGVTLLRACARTRVHEECTAIWRWTDGFHGN
jgi:uncharacterized heparinase superfamily protein